VHLTRLFFGQSVTAICELVEVDDVLGEINVGVGVEVDNAASTDDTSDDTSDSADDIAASRDEEVFDGQGTKMNLHVPLCSSKPQAVPVYVTPSGHK